MDTETYSEKNVVRISNEQFINARLHASRYGKIFRKLGGNEMPSTFVVDWDGDLLVSLSGIKLPDVYLKALSRGRELFAGLSKAKQAVEKSPEDLAARFGLGRAFEKVSLPARATEIYEQRGRRP